MPVSQSEDGKRRERIRWHCRRGMLELDLVLQRFITRHLATLDEAQLDELEALLKLPDTDLLDIVLGHSAPPHGAAIVKLMLD